MLAVTVVAGAFRVVDNGAAAYYTPDLTLIDEALRLASRLTLSSVPDVRSAGHASSYVYPLVLSYYLLGAYGLLFGLGFVAGVFPDASAFGNYLITHRVPILPQTAVLALTLVTAAAVPVAYRVSRRLNPAHTGWLAAGLVTFDLLLVQMSHQPRPHAPLATLALVAVALLASVASGRGGARRLIAATIASGLVFGTLQSGAVILVPFGFAWMIRLVDAWRDQRLGREAAWCAASVATLGGLIGLFDPQALTDYLRFGRDVVTGAPFYSLAGGDHAFARRDFSLSHVPALITGLFGYQPLPVVLLPVALPLVIWKLRRRWRVLVVGLPLPLINAIMWGAYGDPAPRFWATLALFNCILCAYLVEEVMAWSVARFALRKPLVVGAALLVVVGPSAVHAAQLDVVLSRTDTRVQAERWIATNLPPGSRVIDGIGLPTLLPTQASLRRQSADDPGSLSRYGQWLLERSASEYPSGPAFDIVDRAPWLANAPATARLLRSRAADYAVVEDFERPTDLDALLRFAQQNGEAVQTFCPGRNGADLSLPLELYRGAWQRIWQVDRPGPIVVVYRLGGPTRNPPAPMCRQ